jgi:hypothetical protein
MDGAEEGHHRRGEDHGEEGRAVDQRPARGPPHGASIVGFAFAHLLDFQPLQFGLEELTLDRAVCSISPSTTA